MFKKIKTNRVDDSIEREKKTIPTYLYDTQESRPDDYTKDIRTYYVHIKQFLSYGTHENGTYVCNVNIKNVSYNTTAVHLFDTILCVSNVLEGWAINRL